jgi:hypothetical protein
MQSGQHFTALRAFCSSAPSGTQTSFLPDSLEYSVLPGIFLLSRQDGL